jgi:hypothetical protein
VEIFLGTPLTSPITRQPGCACHGAPPVVPRG